MQRHDNTITASEKGYYDCKYGVKHTSKHGLEYDKGYAKRYQEEQNLGAKS